MPEFPYDTAIFGIIGAIIAVAAKIFLGKKKRSSTPATPKPPPVDTTGHAAATQVVTENFDEETLAISEANDETDTADRLDRLAGLANKGKRR